jgi:hypothetical protein
MNLALINAAYKKVKTTAQTDVRAAGVAAALSDAADQAHKFLTMMAKEQTLKTSIPGRTYFAYKHGSKLSRAINADQFIKNRTLFLNATTAILSAKGPKSLGADDATKAIYTVAMSFCAAIDLLKSGDKKSPATYFENLIGHLIAMRIGVSPTSSIDVLNLDTAKGGTQLPTDLIFDPGKGKTKFHVPVKLSTRERVIQAWAHQRVLDGVYGARRFSGLLMVMSETLLSQDTKVVTEVCLPDQWRIYQMFIAWLTRVYYLDIPVGYMSLSGDYPKIEVKGFGHFFLEADAL